MMNVEDHTMKKALLDALELWVAQRPRFEPANYIGAPAVYRADVRTTSKHLHEARAMIAYARRSSITAHELHDACRSAYSGRLRWDSASQTITYMTGQYWPTEYRAAVCAVLSSAIRQFWTDRDMPPIGGYGVMQWGNGDHAISTHALRVAANDALEHAGGSAFGYVTPLYSLGRNLVRASAYVVDRAQREFGRGAAKAWF